MEEFISQHSWLYASVEACITEYFHAGYQYKTIMNFLSTYHGMHLTLQQLKYIINKKLSLRRVENVTSPGDILQAISLEIEGPRKLLGYKTMIKCA